VTLLLSLPLVLAVFAMLLPGIAQASPDAKRLYDNLLRSKNNRYNKLIRPVSNTSDKLVVRLGLRLTQIINVVSKHCSSTSL
jgi:nicotinic acetylcholine receptor